MKNIKKIPFLFPLIIWIAGCHVPADNSTPNLNPLKAEEWIRLNPKGQLIDVRTPEEYQQEHLKGAKLIPLQELDKHLGEIDRNLPVLLYCHSGRRSLQALSILKSSGFKNLQQIEGGITAWKEAKLPVEGAKP